MCEANHIIQQLRNTLNDAYDKFNTYRTLLSVKDKEISDIYHRIESMPNQNLGGAYALYKDLRANLRQRRVLKMEIQSLQELINDLDPKGIRQKLMDAKRKIDWRHNNDENWAKSADWIDDLKGLTEIATVGKDEAV